MRIADLFLRLQGATSGEQVIRTAAASSGAITLPAGTVDFTSTGGAGQVVKQTTVGGPFTVAQVAATEITGLSSLYLPLAGGTLTGKLVLQNATTAEIDFNNTTAPISAGGLWRWVLGTAGNFNLNVNTATAGDFSTQIQVMWANPSGQVTIGTSTGPASPLTLVTPANVDNHLIFNGARSWLVGVQGLTSVGEFWIYDGTRSALPLAIDVAGNTRFAGAMSVSGNIASAGNVISVTNGANPTLAVVNTTGTPAYLGIINSSNNLFFSVLTSALAYNYTLGNFDLSGNLAILGGTATKPGGGSWAVPSDARLKRGVQSYEKGLEAVRALDPIAFEYNGRGGMEDTGRRHVGLDAEAARDVLPEMVELTRLGTTPDEPGEDFLTVDPSALTYVLINAVKELVARLERIEKELL